MQISKLSLILKFHQDFMEKLKKNKSVNFYICTVYYIISDLYHLQQLDWFARLLGLVEPPLLSLLEPEKCCELFIKPVFGVEI